MKLAELLKTYRVEHRISAREFAKSIGVSNTYISLIEKGETKSPTFDMLKKIAKGMSLDVDELVNMLDDDTIVSVRPKTMSGIRIPVLGRVIAGIPIEAVEEIIDYEEIAESLAKTGEFFALQIKGDSMEPEMREGDIAIVRKQETAETGNIAIVLVNGDDATVKKVRILDEGIMLIPFNAKYTPWAYTAEECESLPVRIIGKVIECRRKY